MAIICRNPLGRTGLRGKGSLWRWGPNHVIKAVVTRWRRKQVPDGSNTAAYLYVEGKRVLEFITVYIDTIMDSGFGLPGVMSQTLFYIIYLFTTQSGL